MNPVAVVTHFSTLPAGVTVENRRSRVTVVVGMAASLCVPMPSSPIVDGELRGYFATNSAWVRDAVFSINEAMPLDLDRTNEYAYRLWERRYNLAFNPLPADLVLGKPFAQVLIDMIPEIESLAISDSDVRDVVQMINSTVAV